MCLQAFDRLSAYISAYHSNVVSEFRNFDKDCSGALSVDELRKAARTPQHPLPAPPHPSHTPPRSHMDLAHTYTHWA